LQKANGAENIDSRQHLFEDVNMLITEYEKIWHARSRPGGFAESVARMHKMRTAYK